MTEKQCPLCGGDNRCGVASGACWCWAIRVPERLRERIPAESRGVACICQACVERYEAEQEAGSEADPA